MVYDEKMTVKDLLILSRQLEVAKDYIVDKFVEDTSCHKILRLPPYHYFYNPIELVWGLVKRYFDKIVGRNNDYSDEAVKKYFEEALAQVTPEIWTNCCDLIDRRIREDYELEVVQGVEVTEANDVTYLLSLKDFPWLNEEVDKEISSRKASFVDSSLKTV